MISLARCTGFLPRRSAIPCSVMSTLTECSDWSTCDTIGTIAEILPSLAVEGVVKIEMYALRVKSQEPPMPFIILVPRTCVELTFPKMSASRAVLIVMSPSRRATSGLLESSSGRRQTCCLKKSRLL